MYYCYFFIIIIKGPLFESRSGPKKSQDRAWWREGKAGQHSSALPPWSLSTRRRQGWTPPINKSPPSYRRGPRRPTDRRLGGPDDAHAGEPADPSRCEVGPTDPAPGDGRGREGKRKRARARARVGAKDGGCAEPHLMRASVWGPRGKAKRATTSTTTTPLLAAALPRFGGCHSKKVRGNSWIFFLPLRLLLCLFASPPLPTPGFRDRSVSVQTLCWPRVQAKSKHETTYVVACSDAATTPVLC
jgi:hypothetical protein